MEPINYLQNVADPFAQALSGLKFGQAVAAQQQEQELIKQKQLQQQQYQQALARLQLPTATAADFENVMMISGKDQAETLKNVLSARTTRQNQADIGRVAPIAFALKTGNTDEAISLMNKARDAAANSGDAQDAQYFSKMSELAKTQPENVGNLFATKMTLIPGGKDALDNLLKLTQERRTESSAIPALQTAEAGARKAGAEADVAVAIKPFKISEASSTSIIKAAEAKLAPDKFLADLGLTKSQIEASKAARRASDAAAAKSGAEATRAKAEANQMAAGVIPLDKRPEAETKFRTEYNNQTKPFQEVKSAYARVLASEDTAVGDLSLIFGYMKMLDPGSVVREGEFATAQNAAGVPERVQNIYNKIITGERLNKSQRGSFKGQAEKLYTAAGQQEANVRSGIERIAKGYGLNTANIFYSPTEKAPTAPTSSIDANQIPTPSTTVSAPARNISVNY